MRSDADFDEVTVGGKEWQKTGSLKSEFGELPGTCREEVVGIIGGGELGDLPHRFSSSVLKLLLRRDANFEDSAS